MDPRSLPNALKTTERKLKHLDLMDLEVKIPNSEDYYQDLHDRIMAKVENTEIQPPKPFYKSKDLLKRHWRQCLYLVTVSILAAVIAVKNIDSVSQQFNSNHAVVKFKNEDQLIGLLKSAPEVLDNTVLSAFANQDLMSDGVYSNIDLTKELLESN